MEDDEIIKPQYVIEKLHELTGGDAIITTEVGQNQMWAAQFYKFNHPRHFSPPADSAPWATACRRPSAPRWPSRTRMVIDIAGDGSIQMNIQELATARQCGCPVKIAILNNNYLGMVRQWQELFYDKPLRLHHDGGDPGFCRPGQGLRRGRPAATKTKARSCRSSRRPWPPKIW